jgi:LmbE family N-acetylglucosaminyl deacetylase
MKKGLRSWKITRRRLAFVLGASLLISAVLIFTPLAKPDTFTLGRYALAPNFKPSDRITIVSPHLDDETLGVGGVISRARSQGIPVSVIFMTNGDDNPIGADLQYQTGYPTPDILLRSGESRQLEALGVLHGLGVSDSSIYFLGLPDRGLSPLLQPRYATSPYSAPGTLQTSSPYSRTFIAHLPYTGQATTEALTKALQETAPTIVLTTLPEDQHKDHAATAQFVQKVLPTISSHPRLDYFLIHYRGFPRPKGISRELPLAPPKNLEQRNWQLVFLSDAEITKKQQAVEAYKTQVRIPQLGNLMRSLVRRNELLLPSQ